MNPKWKNTHLKFPWELPQLSKFLHLETQQELQTLEVMETRFSAVIHFYIERESIRLLPVRQKVLNLPAESALLCLPLIFRVFPFGLLVQFFSMCINITSTALQELYDLFLVKGEFCKRCTYRDVPWQEQAL